MTKRKLHLEEVLGINKYLPLGFWNMSLLVCLSFQFLTDFWLFVCSVSYVASVYLSVLTMSAWLRPFFHFFIYLYVSMLHSVIMFGNLNACLLGSNKPEWVLLMYPSSGRQNRIRPCCVSVLSRFSRFR